jgi:hypothetical protein
LTVARPIPTGWVRCRHYRPLVPSSALKNWQPPRCSECDSVLTQSAAGTKCRSCLEGDRVKCITCGSDIYGLYKQCLYCHQSKVFAAQQAELRKRGRKGNDYAALCRQEAWHREREAKRTQDADRRAALLQLAAEMRRWADGEDAEALAGSEPVPLVDRVGVERGS